MPILFKKSEFNEVDEHSSRAVPITAGRDVPKDMMAHSELVFAVQQRVSLFILAMIGSRAQFLRWDRSSVVVIKAFNYVQNWRFFCDILWRIGNCSSAQLGLDPTATRLSEADPDWCRMLTAAHEKHRVDHSERMLGWDVARGRVRHSLVPGWPWYHVKVPVEVSAGEKKVPDGEKFRHFLIAKPTFRAKGMTGRGTGGYVALDCVTDRFIWLKDAWRANYEFIDKEGDILAALNEGQVSNVPMMLCHGDISGQATETPDWWEREKEAREKEKEKEDRERQERDRSTSDSSTTDSSRTCVNSSSSTRKKRQREDGDQEASPQSATKTKVRTLRRHKHYRLVVQEVAMPLDRFEYPQQLVRVLFDEQPQFAGYILVHKDVSLRTEDASAVNAHQKVTNARVEHHLHLGADVLCH
ncbi:hypothetical protein LXA43DRAFT_1160285 [Ganoderma leucocontextum]|nr:hypothetical protein LXA43DRAFT_1160285 [Ganoderma leucocontextum]